MSLQAQNRPSQSLGSQPKTAAWRRETSSHEAPKHEWQTARNEGVRSAFVKARVRVAIATLLLLFTALSGLLIYELLLLPAKTIFIAAIAEDYRWPLPPSGWSHEDIDALRSNPRWPNDRTARSCRFPGCRAAKPWRSLPYSSTARPGRRTATAPRSFTSAPTALSTAKADLACLCRETIRWTAAVGCA